MYWEITEISNNDNIDGLSSGLNLKHWLFRISEYLCYSLLSQNSVYYLLWRYWIVLRLSNIGIYWIFIFQKCRTKKNQKKVAFRMKLIFVLVSTLISKIGAQKNYKLSYRSQCSHYKRLFASSWGETWLIIFWKLARRNHYGQWRHLTHHDQRFFTTRYWRYWCERCLTIGFNLGRDLAYISLKMRTRDI